MERSLEKDLAQLGKLAFKRRARCGPLVERFHGLKEQIELVGEGHLMWNVYDWLLVPLMLWPIDFEGLARHTLKVAEGKESRDRAFTLLLRMVSRPPTKQTQRAIAEYEREVEEGRYHRMVRQPSKFDERETELERDEQLAELWEEIKEQFETSKYQNKRGVIRRRLSQERNFREGWQFDWRDERSRFYAVFEAFCYTWDLYGMEKDKPLLMKISVNPTPYGTLLFIPRTWSFDPKRDLDWGAITRLHRVQGAGRQGPKLSEGRMDVQRQAGRA